MRNCVWLANMPLRPNWHALGWIAATFRLASALNGACNTSAQGRNKRSICCLRGARPCGETHKKKPSRLSIETRRIQRCCWFVCRRRYRS